MRSLSLNEPSFRRCLRDEATNARIVRDIDECAKAGVVGVPVLLINGRKLAGAQPIEAFRKLIDEELALLGKEVR
jgi:predicted DsbA family dithiol-disulfide isomerase